MFVRFVRDFYYGPGRFVPQGTVLDLDFQAAMRLIMDNAAVAASVKPDPIGRTWTVVAHTTTPVGIPSSGSIAANGALSGIGSFSVTYTNGIYLYFPAGAVYAGSPAGFYWTIMSAANTGTIYQEMWTGPGAAEPPIRQTPIVAAGPGAYTQTSGANIVIFRTPLPANLLGIAGLLSLDYQFSQISNANGKVLRVLLGTSATLSSSGMVSAATHRGMPQIVTRGSNRQINKGQSISAGNGGGFSSEDTSVDNAVTMDLNMTTATDWAVLETITATMIGTP